MTNQLNDCVSWLTSHTVKDHVPLYTSMDIRVHHDRYVVVDTNLFPAGFNNIHPSDYPGVSSAFSNWLTQYAPKAQSILIVCEENTRNAFYLSHLHTLGTLLESAGFSVRMATFLSNQPGTPDKPGFCHDADHAIFHTDTGFPIQLWCLNHVLKEVAQGHYHADLAILNNDLSDGLPFMLHHLSTPMYPSPLLGWYQRKKSDHFDAFHRVVTALNNAHQLPVNWFSCAHTVCDHVDITEANDRERLAESIRQIQAISGCKVVFVKHDAGTYGMGVMAMSGGDDMVTLNRKGRNRLGTGKGGQAIHRYLVQEGVASTLTHNGRAAEWVVVNVGTQLVGAFLRVNDQKSELDNLNATGMGFVPMALSDIAPDVRQRLELAALIGIKAVCDEWQAVKGGNEWVL